jgi:hypothetical protein
MARQVRLKMMGVRWAKVSYRGSSVWVDKENSLRTVHSNSEVLYTNTGWSVHCFRAGSNMCHR